MLTSIMPETVTLPVFGGASAPAPAPANNTQQNGGEWRVDSSGGDGMDFDLLAEYLLDDNPSSAAGISFDFNADSANASTVVSPEQSVTGVAPPPPAPAAAAPPPVAPGPAPLLPAAPAPAAPAPAHQIIVQHHPPAVVQQMHVAAPQLHQQQVHHIVHHQPQVVMAPVAAPAPLAPAPATIHTRTPMVAAQGITLPPNATVAYAQPQAHIAPAPPAMGGVNATIAQQPTVAVTKRRRTDVPVMAMAGAPGGPPVLADPMAVAAALQGRGRKKTQAQIDRRRERNRILARRTRLRKKFFFESLQKEVVDLQRENAALKEIVRSQMAEDGKEILTECNAMENLPQAVVEACGEQVNEFDQQDFNLVRSIQQSQHSFIITDPSLQDNPIVFASDGFLSITGYSREDVLGRNCRFLQGTETSQEKVESIRKGISMGEDVSITIANYTADGVAFWNKLFIAALRDAQNNIVNFIGVVAKVASPEPDDPEHGKRLPGETEEDEDTKLMIEEDGADPTDAAAVVADGTVKAIEGAVDAAVAAAHSSVIQS